MKYYEGTKLLNAKDKNGKTPVFRVCDGNRGCGKTIYFNRYVINRFKKHGEKFILLYRYKNELENVAQKFFGDVGQLFFVDDEMTEKSKEHGLYIELKLNKTVCGYAMSLNSAYRLKKLSHLFTDVRRFLFDEFQNDCYVPQEITKFVTLYESIARGHGECIRDVEVLMMCNHLSDMNPYYRLFNLVNECSSVENGFIRGNGVVIEKVLNTDVIEAKEQNGFYQAIQGSKAIEHSLYNKSLHETNAFIEEIKYKNFAYICNFKCDNAYFALKVPYGIDNVNFYFTDKVDYKVNTRYVFSLEEHNNDTLMTGAISDSLLKIRRAFEAGRVRFSDVQTKTYALMLLNMVDDTQYN